MCTPPLVTAFVSLGSNEGNPRANLAQAARALGELDGVRVVAASSVYDTEPQGYVDQAWFANQVLKLQCQPACTPHHLLRQLLAIENKLGRMRSADPALRFGPRRIDLDVLLMGDVCLATAELTLPHPRLHERAFVLVPLLEVEPALTLPNGRKALDLLQNLTYTLEGTRIHQ